MQSQLVLSQRRRILVARLAYGALIADRFLLVLRHVLLQVGARLEGHRANFALIRFLPVVDSLMTDQVRNLAEFFVAHFTLVRLLLLMDGPRVLLECALLNKALVANFADERFVARMCPHMILQRTLALETLPTIFVLTDENLEDSFSASTFDRHIRRQRGDDSSLLLLTQ